MSTTGADLLAQFDRGHRTTNACPNCLVDVSTTRIVDLVYTFEVCSCDAAEYDHLTEALWHRWCFLGRLVFDDPDADSVIDHLCRLSGVAKAQSKRLFVEARRFRANSNAYKERTDEARELDGKAEGYLEAAALLRQAASAQQALSSDDTTGGSDA